eukprot:4173515-Amphidinium_carterae.4
MIVMKSWAQVMVKRLDNLAKSALTHAHTLLGSDLETLKPIAQGGPQGTAWDSPLDWDEDDFEKVKEQAEKTLYEADIQELKNALDKVGQAMMMTQTSTN